MDPRDSDLDPRLGGPKLIGEKMKKPRKLILPVLLCMAVAAANLISIGFPVMTAHAGTVYTVTLLPGEGEGDPVIYRSDEGTIAESWRTARACDFYYENGEIGFCLPNDHCPDSFTAPEGYTFNGWEDNTQYNNLASTETSFTAKWRLAGGAKITLGPSVIEIKSDSFDAEGYAPVSIEIKELDFGADTESLTYVQLLLFQAELWLPDQSDKMTCQIYSAEHDRGGGSLSTDCFIETCVYRFALYIDPEVLAAATPGTYAGEIGYYIDWNGIEDSEAPEDGTMPIKLTVTGNDSALPPSGEPSGVLIHRMYNPYSGEHFYTGSEEERNILITAGWIYEEGSSFTAPEEADDTVPVYRLYDPNGAEHLFTINKEEAKILEERGWISEGIRFYAYDTDAKKGVHLYRAYNPNDGHHILTTDKAEQDYLVSLGWSDEGVAWDAVD